MRSKVKSCVSCTFCVRQQETFKSFHQRPELSKWVHDIDSLTANQRNLIRNGSLEFMGEGIRVAAQWDELYKKKRADYEKRREDAGNGNILEQIRLMQIALPHSFSSHDDELEILGLPRKPEAPNYDYLACYHEQWTEDDKRKDPVNTEFLNSMTCEFYYSYENKGRKTLSACEKVRVNQNEQKRFKTTNWLIIVGVIVTVLSSDVVWRWVGKLFSALTSLKNLLLS